MRRFLVFFSLCFLATAVRGQDIYTRTEFGAEFSTIRQAPPGGGGKNYPGFGGRFDWNLTRRLALETQVDFFPEHSGELFYRQGGQTLQAVAGIRAKVIQTRRLSVFGLVRPGVFHFTDVLFENNSAAGFSVQQLTWANSVLFPPAVAKRLLERFQASSPDGEPDLWMPPAPLNAALEQAVAVESALIPRRVPLPFGLSLLAVARAA